MESQVMMHENVVFVLLGIADVASTFAGFAGVVATFGRRAQGKWLPEERFRLINIIVLSLVACLFSFVPLLIIAGIAVRVPGIDAVEFNRAVNGMTAPGSILHMPPAESAYRFRPLRKDCIGPVLRRCESRTVWSIAIGQARCDFLPVNRNRRNKSHEPEFNR